jgi:hypothetical protein
MSYNRILFLPPNTDMPNEKLAHLLTKTFGGDKKAQILVKGKRVEVKWGDWSLRVYYEIGPNVLNESKEIIAGYGSQREDRETLALCDKWISIGSDRDYDVKHFNHFLFLLQDLEENFPEAVLFVSEEGTFFDVGNFN